jgi:GNAT superfamily N-acetyltransferase
MPFRVAQVPAARTYALRQQVLRPHQPLSAMGAPDDDAPPSASFAALDEDGAVVGTAVVRPAPCPWRPEEPAAWRLRGVAALPDVRNKGIGTALLRAVIAYVEEQGGGLVWCNARTPALSLYLREGFVTEGDEWLDPDIGPHIRMWRHLPSAS